MALSLPHFIQRGILPFLLACADAHAGTTDDLKIAVVRHHAALVDATYQDSLAAARSLRTAIDAFLASPGDATLAAARNAWIASRKPYLQSEAFRFYEGPIDAIDGRVNAWPVDEGYIDYVAEDPAAGIINHPELHPALTEETLIGTNEKDGEKSISTGFHAIEFLLWGQDHDPKGPGARSWRDYSLENASAIHPERRREYLRLAAGLLVKDFEKLVAEWEDGRAENYRAWFVASAPHQSLRKILHGIGTLGGTELAGERLTVAYETKEQEDEHSCFSDTTHTDMALDVLGIRNVFTGCYERPDGTCMEGPGLKALLEKEAPELAVELARQIDASLEAARSIPAPFDQAMLGPDSGPGRMAIHRTIRALQEQTDTIAKAAARVGVRDDTE